jgi:RHS repeat-associated protein
MRDTIAVSSVFGLRAEDVVVRWLGFLLPDFWQRHRGPEAPESGRGFTPPAALSRPEKESNVASIQINPADNVVLQSREPMQFAAIPVDSQGVPVHGVGVEWESTNREIVFVKKNGEVIGGKPGTAILTATAGTAKESVRITVVEGTKEKFGGKKQNSTRSSRKIASNSSRSTGPKVATTSGSTQKRSHAIRRPFTMPMFLRPPAEDPLPDDETGSLFSPANNVGAPPGKTRPGGFTPSAAIQSFENGNKNFSFGLPIVDLQGRGLNVGLNLTYNSLLYNKSTDPSDGTTWLTYDVDSGYPAPGFRLGYGQIEDQGAFGFTLVDGDGTRHALKFVSTNNYETNDGSFIRFTGGRGWGTLFYPDGTQVTYGAAGGGVRSYPTRITDHNGNYITISYESGVGPRINSVKDTLERYVRFFYATNGDLISITAPGLTSQPDREVMRFIYQDITFSPATLFSSTVNKTLPSSAHVIKYIFLPNSVETNNAHIGYRFDHSDYGMIYKIVQFRGMVLNSGSTAVANEGITAATTTYNYPGTPVNTTTGISDVPTYTTRTDDWAGRTTGMSGNPAVAPFYTFSVDETNGISTVTAPDGAVTETRNTVHPGLWDDGLIKETFLDKQGTTALAHTVIDWEQGVSGTPRVAKTRFTNESGLTKATVFSYGTFNNLTTVSERDFSSDGSVSSTELRRTETTYVTTSAYVDRRLLHLPESVKVFKGGATTPISRVDYAYDNYGNNHASLVGRSQIVMHDPAYDPFAPNEESCHWQCTGIDENGNCTWEWVCNQFNPYDPATDIRGNVTSVTKYPDANSTSNLITNANTYDIAGNVMSAQVNCCKLKTYSYTDSPDSHTYAYRTSETRGDPNALHLSTSTSYDFNTGLITTTTDENAQVTTAFYNPDSLRLDHVTGPDGGAAYLTYSDALEADANGKSHYFVQTQSKLDAPSGTARYITSRRYFDGRDEVARTLDNFTAADGYVTQDTEYDVMGRPYRVSNPYFASGYSAAINPSGFWTSSSFDHLGRVTIITAPRGDDDNTLVATAQLSYDGVFTTVTDQAGKSRRQKLDALGRVIRLDEPDASGSLGATTAPNLSTAYEYDVLDNLVHVSQPGPNSITQHRYFKFDSLSRLIRERQVEQTVNPAYDLTDPLTNNSSWTRKTEYNADGLVSDVYDARGVHTQISYDTLNRATTITYSDSTPAAHYYYDSQTLPNGAPVYTHGYANGRLIAATYGSGATGTYFGYDQAGRVNVQRQVTGSATYSLSYGYNLSGLLTSETYNSGRTVNYVFDEGGRLTSLNDGTTTFAQSLSYVAHGALKAETWGNGAVHSRLYNRRLQTSEVKLKQSASGAELQRFNYSYGQVTQATGTVDTSKNNGQLGRVDAFVNGASTKEWDQRFVYDELGRLSTAAEYQQGNNSSKTWQVQYTYDRWGNRFQSGSGNSGVFYTPVLQSDIDAATNRFIASGATPTTYDEQGNIKQDIKFRWMNYVYDANGRMTSSERIDQTVSQSAVYDCAGQRVQTTANGVTRTMVYDIFGQNVADYTSSGNSLERENIYRGGQLLAVVQMTGATGAPPSGLTATFNGTNISLSWSPASGATNYRVEKRAATSSYTLVGTTSSTNLTDTNVSAESAYLYKVCAASADGTCASSFSNVALGTTITFATDPIIRTIADDPSGAIVTQVKAAHITELRTAVNTVRGLAGLPAGSWTNSAITAGVTIVSKDDILDLRNALDEALLALAINISAYTDTINGAPNGTLIRGIHITQLRQRVQSGVGAQGSGGNNCYKSLSQFVNDFYQGALKRPPTAAELQQQTNVLAQAQLQGQAQLIAAAQNLGAMLFNSSEYLALQTTNPQYITDLYQAYLQRLADAPGHAFWLNKLNSGETRFDIRRAFDLAPEFHNNVKALCLPATTSNGIKYVLSDVQGSARAIMNNGTVGSSTIVSRHDYLPFGEELWAGTGLRSTAQGYNTADQVRQKFGLIERDEITGLDHTLWRKYENMSGRWTSADPFNGAMSVADPQSFNRYSYVENDPVNQVDPTGLYWAIDLLSCRINWVWKPHIEGGGDWVDRGEICNITWVDDRPLIPVERPGGGTRTLPQVTQKQTANDCRKKALQELAQELGSREEIFSSNSMKLIGMLLTTRAGAMGGATVGSVILPGPGTVAGGIVGGAGGFTVGAFINDAREAKVEQGPVGRFYEKDKECQKLARQERNEARRSGEGASVSAAPAQMFVITRQFGTFAMYPYTIQSGPTLLGDYVFTTFGRNGNDRVTRRVGR